MAKTGRPSKYKPEYAEQARNYCVLGATDKDLAGFFDVSEVTVNAWKKAHPEFLKSLKAGKATADAAVAEALYRRAIGCSHDYERVFVHEGKPVKVTRTKHYTPDTAACIFWLRNRRPGQWRDKQEAPLGELVIKIDDKPRERPHLKLVASAAA